MTQAAATLLDRGLHYIHAALDALLFKRQRIDSPIGAAVLYAALGIELVLKHRLFVEHWTLIFSEPSRASRVEFEAGTFHSVSVEVALKRLKDVCCVPIVEGEQNQLLDLSKARNKLVHFGLMESEDAAMSCVGLAVHTVLQFIAKAYAPTNLSANQLEAIKEIRTTGAKCLAFVEAKWGKIRENVVGIWKSTGIFRCPRCYQIAAFLKDKKVSCLFCDYSSDDFEELLNENLVKPRRPNANARLESGCCSDLVFNLEWKAVDGELLEREKVCFGCCKRIEFWVQNLDVEC